MWLGTRTKIDDISETVNNRVKENQKIYMQRQMIVEHPLGTLKRVINILGVKKLLGFLIERFYFVISIKYKIIAIVA